MDNNATMQLTLMLVPVKYCIIMVCRVDLSVKQIVIKSVPHLPWTSLHVTDRHTHPSTHKTHTAARTLTFVKSRIPFLFFSLLLSGGEWEKKKLFGHRYEAVIPSESERCLRWRHRTAWLKCCDCNSVFPQENVSLTWLVCQAWLKLWLTSPNFLIIFALLFHFKFFSSPLR